MCLESVHTTYYIRWTIGDIIVSGQWWTYGPILYVRWQVQGNPPIHSTLYVQETCSSASPSKFHQPEPNQWCIRFQRQVDMRKDTDHKNMISDIISCLQDIFSIQYNWHKRIELMYFTVAMWFLNSCILLVQESETSTALTKVNMCCHLWETIKMVIKDRDKRYMGTA